MKNCNHSQKRKFPRSEAQNKSNKLLEQLNDITLMNAVKAGNLDLMGLLFERHSRTLFGFFYNLTHHGSHSEDCVQVVFYRMMKYRKNFRGEGKFTTWMFSIARNVWIDEGKKLKQKHQNIADWENELSDDQNRETLWEADDERKLLRHALQQLKPEEREVLVLSKIKELKYGQIAEVLACSEGNVKIKVFRAMKSLKAIFQKLPQ